MGVPLVTPLSNLYGSPYNLQNLKRVFVKKTIFLQGPKEYQLCVNNYYTIQFKRTTIKKKRD